VIYPNVGFLSLKIKIAGTHCGVGVLDDGFATINILGDSILNNIVWPKNKRGRILFLRRGYINLG